MMSETEPNTVTLELTESEVNHLANTMEAKAKDWESEGRDGYAHREREYAKRLRGERERPITEGDR